MSGMSYHALPGLSNNEPFIAYGIQPGFVKQVREKFQSEISMHELSKNSQSFAKHHSATARLASEYENILHNELRIQRHNTYPSRRIQSAGRVSDSSYSSNRNTHKFPRPSDRENLSPSNGLKKNTNNQGNTNGFSQSHSNQTATIIRNHSVKLCRFDDDSSVRKKEMHSNRHSKSFSFSKPSGSDKNWREPTPVSHINNKPNFEFRQPAPLPKPTKSELMQDPLINFIIPRGFQASNQFSQRAYDTDAFSNTHKSPQLLGDNVEGDKLNLNNHLHNNLISQGKHTKGNKTIKIDPRNTQNSSSPFKPVGNIHIDNPQNTKLLDDSYEAGNKNQSNSKIRTTVGDGHKSMEYLNTKENIHGGKMNVIKTASQGSIVHKTNSTSGDFQTLVLPVVSSEFRNNTTSSGSIPPTSILSPSQSRFNIVNGNTSYSSKRNPKSEPICDLTSANSTIYSTKLTQHLKKTERHDDVNQVTFHPDGFSNNGNLIATAEAPPALHKSEFKVSNVPQVTHLSTKHNEEVSVSNTTPHSSGPFNSTKPPLTVNPENIDKGENKHNVVGENGCCPQNTDKITASESDTASKQNAKSSNLPYHKRQVNCSILDSVMGEMQQLFAGKQTITPSKKSKIHDFAREKAMQCREEREDDRNNLSNITNVNESTENEVVEPNPDIQIAGTSASTATDNFKRHKQSKSFQSALQAVEKNLKLVRFSESKDSSNFVNTTNEGTKHCNQNVNGSLPGNSDVRKHIFEPGSPVPYKMKISNNENFIKHQNLLNELNSTQVISMKSPIKEENQRIENHLNERLVENNELSDSSISDSQFSITRARTSFPRLHWPIVNSYMWSSNKNSKTFIHSAYNIDKIPSNENDLNHYQNGPYRQHSHSIKRFPRLSTFEIPCERPKSAPVKNGLRKLNTDLPAYAIHQPG
uniref:Uncharacterized protein n=1 Tax=Trichobilharzia regenti TaxID=157069 RepID=A0AA85JXV2_TRIRE|nr:unnamed protein product [Trichobilharzia regenti]